VTASVYSVPAERSAMALARRTHEANRTGQSARLRWTTADHRPLEMGSAGSSTTRCRGDASAGGERAHGTITRVARKGSGGR
jgi:hypothetical protein